jgi:ketosteroid isomerase-like protein
VWQRAGMDRDEVMRWVAGYERAWRAGDVPAVVQLFTEDARYLTSPYSEPKVGLAAIQDFWLNDDGLTFEVTAEPVAVEGRDAVVRLEVRYGRPQPQEYRDLWVLRFAPDGRVEHFEEWAYWPGKSYSAEGDGTEADAVSP